MVSSRDTSAIILILLLIIVIVYCVILFEWYRRQQMIFKPYNPPTPPGPHFYPLGSVRPLSVEEQAARKAFIDANLAGAN